MMRTSHPNCFDRPFGVDEYANGEVRPSRFWAYIIVGFVAVLCKIFWRYKKQNVEALSTLLEKSGALVVSNHTSYLDVVFIYLSMFPKHFPRFMARDTLFEKSKFLNCIFKKVGAFPIKRDSADRVAVKRAVNMLKNGEAVCIMPEGTRRGKGSATPHIHAGAALIARMARSPILPVAVCGVDKVKPKGKVLRFPRISIQYGNPVLVSDFDFLPKEDRLEGCSWYVLRECFALFWQKEPEEIDMVELFPEDKDFTQQFLEHRLPRRSSRDLAGLLSGKAH